jgi:hypothetical protein
MAIVFNPIIPLRFPRSTLRIIDVVAGIVLVVCGFFKKAERRKSE